jgi:type IV fimbrial biogenesis protein FimT
MSALMRIGPRRAPAGLTLIELVIALMIVVVLGAMAMPSFSAMLQQQRLTAAARQLAADLGEARQEAIRRNQTVQVVFGRGGGQWCYALLAGDDDAAAPDCSPRGAGDGARVLKRVTAADHPGIALLEARTMRLAAGGEAVALQTPSASLANGRGEQLRVQLSRLGRVAICGSDAPVGDLPRC